MFSIPVGDVDGYTFSADSKSIGASGVYFTGHYEQPPAPPVTRGWSIEPYRLLDKATLRVSDFDCYCECTRGAAVPRDLQLDKASRIIPQYAAYSPDKRLYAGTVVQGNAYSTQLWDTATGTRIAVMPQNWQPAWSPDGRLLATTGGGAITISIDEHGTSSHTSEGGGIAGVPMSTTHVMVWQITPPTPPSLSRAGSRHISFIQPR